MIPRALEAEILRLHHTEHWPIGTLATQLRVHHSTVRRVLEHLGLPVTRLIRLAYGPFQLGHLARGMIEEVTGKVLQEQLGKADHSKRKAAKK